MWRRTLLARTEWNTRSILGSSSVEIVEVIKFDQKTHDIRRNLDPGFPSVNDY